MVDLGNTGVVSALHKAFQHLRPPSKLGKLDRLTSATAHLWWRTHDEDWMDSGLRGIDAEDLDWTALADADLLTGQEGQERTEELIGTQLRRATKSLEGLRRLMFSTMMLYWNLHRPSSIFAGGVAPRHLTLPEWLDMNLGIESDASNFSVHVQKGIYEAVARAADPSKLLP